MNWQRGYAAVIAAYPEVRFRAGRPTEAGLPSAAQLGQDDAAFAVLLADEARAIRESWGEEARPYVVATRAMLHYAYYAALAVAGPYLAAGLVPDIHPEDFAARLYDPVTLVVDPRSWTDAVEVGFDAARAELRRVHAGLVSPVFAAGRDAARRAPTALWRAAADALAGALWRLGERLHDEHTGAAEASRVLGDRSVGRGGGPGRSGRRPVAPYAGGANFRTVTGPDGSRLLTRDRNDCCLSYTLAAAGPCTNCPRLDETQRQELLASTEPRPPPSSCAGRSLPSVDLPAPAAL